MLIHRIRPVNFLSYGPDTPAIELSSLNVIIGPNGSGKSNLIEALAFLRGASRDLAAVVREGGGARDWIWKGSGEPATLEAIIENPHGPGPLRYVLTLADRQQRLEVLDERLEDAEARHDGTKPSLYFGYENGRPVLAVAGSGEQPRSLRREDLHSEQSILSQRRDPDLYPEITYLSDSFSRIRVYREWTFGQHTGPRLHQRADLPNDILAEDGGNLGLVLNRLRRDPAAKKRILDGLRTLHEGFDDIDVSIEANAVQVFLQEGRWTVPATRLSDGTLRLLALLAILCDPHPSPLICIEEPELGLHPDVIVKVSDLLVEASRTTQIIVTTHSDLVVDSLTESPEVVLVCEKRDGMSTLVRLDRQSLAVWLQQYSLGDLWRKGDLGGNRW